MSDVMQIRRVRQQVERFIDADLLLPEDGQRLLAALDATLAEVTGASAAGGDRGQALIAAGVLSAGQEPLPIEAAAALVAGLASAGGTDG